MNRPGKGYAYHWQQQPKNHDAVPATGGKLARRYRRNIDATRELSPMRRHGTPARSVGFMRPPGSGCVPYQGKPVGRVYTGVDHVTGMLTGGVG